MRRRGPRDCFNCQVGVSPFWWIPLCKDCRRAVQVTGLAVGALVGAAIKILTHLGWL